MTFISSAHAKTDILLFAKHLRILLWRTKKLDNPFSGASFSDVDGIIVLITILIKASDSRRLVNSLRNIRVF